MFTRDIKWNLQEKKCFISGLIFEGQDALFFIPAQGYIALQFCSISWGTLLVTHLGEIMLFMCFKVSPAGFCFRKWVCLLSIQSSDTSPNVTNTRKSDGTTTSLVPFSMSSPPWSSLYLFLYSSLTHLFLSKPSAPSCHRVTKQYILWVYYLYSNHHRTTEKEKKEDLQGTCYHLPTLRRGSKDRISNWNGKYFPFGIMATEQGIVIGYSSSYLPN